jgi:hypothetical protein
MHAIVHAVDVKKSDRLSGLIAEKFNKLGKFALEAVRGDVYLRTEHKDGKIVKVVEVKVQGTHLRSSGAFCVPCRIPVGE